MKKGLLLLLPLLIVLHSCEPRIEDNTRIQIKGTLVNAQGGPVANARVDVFSFEERECGIFAGFPCFNVDEDFILGTNITDASGNFEITSLYSDAAPLLLRTGSNPNTARFFSFISQEPRDVDYLYDLGEVRLLNPALLAINLNNTSGRSENFNYTLRYQVDACNSDRFFGEQVERNGCLATIEYEDRVDVDGSLSAFDLDTVFPSTALLTYLNESGDEIIQIIEVNSENVSYDFNY